MPKQKYSQQKDKAQAQAQTPESHPQNPPNWPALRPLIPSSDLYLDPLLPDHIYLIRNLLTSTLCKTYTSFLSSLPLATTPDKPKRGDAVRVNDRFQIQDARFAEMLWRETALRELVENVEDEDEDEDGRRRSMQEIWGGKPMGLNPNIRIYRYSAGQFFAKHYDDSNTITYSSPSTPPTQARTTWTLLIYLNACTGGETVFYPEPTRSQRRPEPMSVAPEVGLALLHRHGEKCLQHEGMEVVKGEKWVLRSDLVVER